MHSIYTITSGKPKGKEDLKKTEKLSVYYHDFFDYPMTFADLIKWNTSESLTLKHYKIPITCQNGYYFLQGREGLIYKRVLRNRVSAKKMEIAKKASDILSLIPAVLMVAVTGSLAMGNSGDESDIDLIIITKKGTLWTTRAFAYLLIRLFGIQTRKPSDKNQKDKLCLNMWMDETDLVWKSKDRNLYTAHEIAQILPLVNKNKSYEKFLRENVWISQFWPNAINIKKLNIKNQNNNLKLKNIHFLIFDFCILMVEKAIYHLQYAYMKHKITREVVTPTRAIFHPQDLGRYILSRLNP